MPWHVARNSSCPDSRPWAVIKDSDGSVEGCHESQEAARSQMAALYASESEEELQHKSFEVELKADDDAPDGTFDALVAVFGNVDRVGDRIVPGAFTRSLEHWRLSRDPIPIILSHKHNDVWAHIGVADPNDVVETERGLQVRGTLDVDDNETARQVHKLMKRRSLKEFSFGYHVPPGGQKHYQGANELRQINLIELGPTLKGANPATELHAVKSALEKAQWTAAYINTLPDSSFLYIEPGGSKDEEGKTTPRSLRHFPYKDASGKVDLPHLRNALSRIPQSNVSQSVKDRLTAKAQSILNNAKDDPPSEGDLRRRTEEMEFEQIGAPDVEATKVPSALEEVAEQIKGLSTSIEAIREAAENPPPPERSAAEMRRQTQEEELKAQTEGLPPPEPEPNPVLVKVDELAVRMNALGEVVEGLTESLAKVPSEDELRRDAARHRLKEAEVPEGEPEPEPSPLEGKVDYLTEVVAALGKKLDEVPTPSEAELKRRDAQQRLSDATDGIPTAEEGAPPDRVGELSKQIETLAESVGGLNTKLDGIKDRQNEERNGAKSGQDPLRARSEEVVLEVSSGGLSMRSKPPEREPVPESEPSEKALRQRSRDVMLELLTGTEVAE